MMEENPEEMEEEAACPSCGMDRNEWTDNEGKGYTAEGITYCCRGCADGSGCTCG